jgi:hypothetical protein
MATTADVTQTHFDRILADFKSGLKKRDQENFRLTTLEDLEQTMADIQAEQHGKRRLQNLNRLKPFLEGLNQYGNVVDIFCNSSQLLPFVWVSRRHNIQKPELIRSGAHQSVTTSENDNFDTDVG